MDRSRSGDRRRYPQNGSGMDIPVQDGRAYYPRYFSPWIAGSDKQVRQPTTDDHYYSIEDNGGGGMGYAYGYYGGTDFYDNPGYMTHEPMRGHNYKLHHPPSSGDSYHPDDRHTAKSRRCCVIASIVGLVFLVAAGIGIGIYFGVVDKPETVKGSPTGAPPTAIAVDMQLTMDDQTYTPNLNNPDSVQYKQLKTQAENEIDNVMQNSPLVGSYIGNEVYALSEGSVKVHSKLKFENPKYYNDEGLEASVTAGNVKLEFETQIRRTGSTVFNANKVTAKTASVVSKSRLGDNCTSSVDCFISEATCQGSPSICICESGYYDSNGANVAGACLTKLVYDQSGCSNADVQCLTTNAVCLTGKCLCDVDKFHFNNACFPFISLGDSGCVTQVDSCTTTNAQCEAGTCECPQNNYHDVIDDTCKPQKINGQSCTDTIECLYENASCLNGECSCDDNQYVEHGTNICHQKRPNGQYCDGQFQCAYTNTECVGNLCTCPDGTYEAGTGCFLHAEYGESCVATHQCSTTGSSCRNELCLCDDNDYHDGTDDSCQNKIAYDATCTDTVQCLTIDGSCINDKCTCENTYFYQELSDTCIMKYSNGENCSSVTECMVTDATCDTICTCAENKHLSASETICVDNFDLGVSCTSANQCLYAESVCNNVCECPNDRYADTDAKTCEFKKQNGESCDDVKECSYTDSDCIGNVCTCPDGTYEDGTGCFQKIDIGFACDTVGQCLYTDSICDGLCQCSDGWYPDETDESCKTKLGLGDACSFTFQCLYTNSLCDNECVCPDNMYAEDATESCKQKKNNQVVCGSVEECLFTNAECDVVCQCPYGTYEDGTNCSLKAGYNESCSADVECLPLHSICDTTAQKCLCTSTQFFGNNQCNDKLGDGESCDATHQCSYDNSVCLLDECTCPENMYVSNSQLACLSKKGQGESCDTAVECAYNNSICDSTCTCSDVMYEDGMACLSKKPLDGPCNDIIECLVTDNALCDGGLCTCDSLSYQDGTVCSPLKALGDACVEDRECLFGNAVCSSDNVCACLDTMYSNGQDCVDKLSYNSQCTATEHCSTGGSSCENSKCVCSTTDYFDQGTNECLDKIDIGGSCNSTSQCSVLNAVCDTTCKCLPTSYFDINENTCKPKLDYNATCDTSEQCSTSSSVCTTNSLCQCEDAYFFESTNNACTQKLGIDDVCSAAGQCFYSDSQCTLGFCKCPDETFVDDLNEACTPRKSFSQSCVSDDQCPFDGICSVNICACPQGRFEDVDRCTLKKDNQVSCDDAAQCLFDGAECSTVCQCPSNTYSDGTSCIPLVEYGGSCTENYQCVTINSLCDGQTLTCSCDDDTTFFNVDRCSDKLGAGESCSSDNECSYNNSVCLSNQCSCPDGRWVNNDQASCDLLLINGESCTDHVQCKYDRAVCELGVCKCAIDDYEDGETCLQKKPNGASCNNDNECAIINAYCDTVCTCFDSDFLDNDRCVPKFEQGENCTSSEQCRVDMAVCNDLNVCGCDNTMFEQNDACIEKVLNGESCNSVEECLVINATCTNGICGCSQDDFIEGNECKDKRPNGEDCVSDSYCYYDNATCVNGICDCPPGLLLDGTTCKDLIDVNGECEDVSWCSTTNAICHGTPSVCKCDFNYYYDDLADTCTTKLVFGSSGCIDASLQCKTRNSICSDIGTCSCDDNSFLFLDECIPRKPIGQVCTDVSECFTSEAICNITCRCPSDMYNNGTSCHPMADIGESCTMNAQCKAFRSQCLNSACGCPDQFLYDINTDRCILKKAYNETCSNVENECITSNAECNSVTNRCLCPDGWYLDDIECLPKKANNESCTITDECIVEGSTCNSVCTCPTGTYYDVSCLPQLMNGEACSNTEQCLYGDAGCYSDICACPENHYESGTSCIQESVFGAICEMDIQCGTGQCIESLCDCQQSQYYDESNGQCFAKIGHGSQCGWTDQCETPFSVCNETCTCPNNRFFSNDACLEKLGDGESCTTDTQCNYTNAVCENEQCTCPDDSYVDNDIRSCVPKKSNGALCTGTHECVDTGAQCISNICQCPSNTFQNGTVCSPKKVNGADCGATIQCIIPGAVCDSQCQCPDTKYLHQLACVDRLNFGDTCVETGDCNDLFLCLNSTCRCEQDYEYDPSNHTCFYDPPPTPEPVVDAPDEVIVVGVDGTIVSDLPYSSDLADNSSDAYQSLANETQNAISDGFANDTSFVAVEINGIVPGSRIFLYTVTFDKKTVSVKREEFEIDDGEDIDITVVLFQLTTSAAGKAAAKLEATGVLGVVSAPETSIQVVKDPCLDEDRYASIVNTPVCNAILGYIMSTNKGKCGAFRDLLDCMVINYKLDGIMCEWNVLRTNLEEYALDELGLTKSDVAGCVRGNRYIFNPMGGMIRMDNLCVDPTMIRLAGTYTKTCRDQVKAIKPNQDFCSELVPVVGCAVDVISESYGDYCRPDETIDHTSLSILIDEQERVFTDTNIDFSTCDFCLAPNIFNLWKQNCGKSLSMMRRNKDIGVCTFIQWELTCLAAHVGYKDLEDCGFDSIKEMFRNYDKFFDEIQPFNRHLTYDDWWTCLDSPMEMTFGPMMTADICNNQNYLLYALTVNECVDDRSMDSVCSQMYSSGNCLMDALEHIPCDRYTILRNLYSTDWDYEHTISATLSETGIWNDCWVQYEELSSSDEGMCMLEFQQNRDNIMSACSSVGETDESLVVVRSSQQLYCGLFTQLSECAMSSLGSCMNYELMVQNSLASHMTNIAHENGFRTVNFTPCVGMMDENDACALGLAKSITACLPDIVSESNDDDTECGQYTSFRLCVLINLMADCGPVTALSTVREASSILSSWHFIPQHCISLHDSGLCPVYDEIDEASCGMVWPRCSSDAECGEDSVCCRVGCNYQCIDISPNEGNCPAYIMPTSEECGNEEIMCLVDKDCDDQDKCCSSECGNVCRPSETIAECTLLDMNMLASSVMNTTYIPYEAWKVCESVWEFARIIELRLNYACTMEEILHSISMLKPQIRTWMADHAPAYGLARVELFDYETCKENEFMDIYPCTNPKLIEQAWENTCLQNVRTEFFSMYDPEGENLGVTKDMCRHYFDLVDCITLEMRRYGSNCPPYESIYQDTVYNYIRKFIPSLPESRETSGIVCNASTCSYTRYYESAYGPCGSEWLRHQYYNMYENKAPDMTCMVPETQDEYVRYMTCISLSIVQENNEDCTVQKYIDIMDSDPRPIFFSKNGIGSHSDCIPGDILAQLNSLTTSNVCNSPYIVDFMFEAFCDYDIGGSCPSNLANLPLPYNCLNFYQSTICVADVMNSFGFECDYQQVSTSLDDEFPYNAAEVKDMCNNDGLDECTLAIMKTQTMARTCWEHLHTHTTLSPWNTNVGLSCNLAQLAADCVDNYFNKLELPECNGYGIVKDMIGLEASVYIQRHLNNPPDCTLSSTDIDSIVSSAYPFDTCSEIEDINLCEHADILAYMTLLSCPHGNGTTNSIADACSNYWKTAECAWNMTTKFVQNGCTPDQISEAFMHEEFVKYMDVSPSECTREDSCFTAQAYDIVDMCIPEHIEDARYGFDDICSMYNVIWTCVSTLLETEEVCEPETSDIKDLINTSYFKYHFMYCEVPKYQYDPCTDTKVLGSAFLLYCFEHTHNIRYLTCGNIDEAMTCMLGILEHMCYDDGSFQTRAEKAYVSLAFDMRFYRITDCMGTTPGYCPHREAFNSPCYGALDTCVLDSDCLEGYKCCHDGEYASCMMPATTPATYEVWLVLYKQEYTQSLSDPNSEDFQNLVDMFSEKIGILFDGLEGYTLQKISDAYSDTGPSFVYHVDSFFDLTETIVSRSEKFEGSYSMEIWNVKVISQEAIDDEDRCPDPTIDYIIQCINEEFTDDEYHGYQRYQDYEICRRISDLTNCVAYKCPYNCYNVKDFIELNSDEVINKLELYGNPMRSTGVIYALSLYNAAKCAENYDMDYDPCYTDHIVYKKIEECSPLLADYSINIDQLSCNSLFEFSSCVLLSLRRMGSKWCHIDSISHYIKMYFENEDRPMPDFNTASISTGSSSDTFSSNMELFNQCRDYVPVCSYVGLQNIRYNQCYMTLDYTHDAFCSNRTVKNGVVEFIECASMQALLRDEQCSAADIYGIIMEDRYRLSVLSQAEDLSNCVSDEDLSRISNTYVNRDTLCVNPTALNFYRYFCSPKKCGIYPNKIENTFTKCVLFIQQAACIQREMNPFISCELSDIAETVAMDINSPLYLDEFYSECQGYLNMEDPFNRCQLPLLSQVNGSMGCSSSIHEDVALGEQSHIEDKCSLVSLGTTCLRNKLDAEIRDGCIEYLPSILQGITLASSAALSQIECQPWETLDLSPYETCEGLPLTYDVCMPSDLNEAGTVLDQVTLNCENILTNITDLHNFRSAYHDIDMTTYACRKLKHAAYCGRRALNTSSLFCNVEDVEQIIVDYSSNLAWSSELMNVDLSQCTDDPCQSEMYNRVQECLSTNLAHNMYGGNPEYSCRLYNILHHCVKLGVSDVCDDNIIKSQLFLSIFDQIYWNYIFNQGICRVEPLDIDICTDYDTAKLVSTKCNNDLHLIEYNGCSSVEKILDCYRRSLSLFGTCEDYYPRAVALSAAREYYYQNAVKCLDEPSEGYCPLQLTFGQCRVCMEDERQDTCLSDMMCEPGTKCCHDGCHYTCRSIATEPLASHYVKLSVTDETLVSSLSSIETELIASIFSGYVDQFMEKFVPGDEPYYTIDNVSVDTDSIVIEMSVYAYEDLSGKSFEIKEYIASVAGYSDFGFYIELNLPDFPKEGTCPVFSTSLPDFMNGCCSDNDCSGSLKCCDVGGYQNCIPSAPVDFTIVFLDSEAVYQDIYADLTDPATVQFIEEAKNDFFDSFFAGLMVDYAITGLRPSNNVLFNVTVSMPHGAEGKIREHMVTMTTMYPNIVIESVTLIGERALPECSEQDTLFSSAAICSIDITSLGMTLPSISCGDIYVGLGCVNDLINSDRPVFKECTVGALKDTLMSYNEGLVFDCSELYVTFSFYSYCDTDDEYTINNLGFIGTAMASIFDTNDYLLQVSTCNYGTFEVSYSLYTRLMVYDVKPMIINAYFNISGGQDITTSVRSLDDSLVDRCKNVKTLAGYAIGCIGYIMSSNQYRPYQICSITENVNTCIRNKVADQPDRRYPNCVPDILQDSELRHSILSNVADKFQQNNIFLSAIMNYNFDHCINGDINPCSNPDLGSLYYDECSTRTGITELGFTSDESMNYNATKETCRNYFKLAECIMIELRKSGERCEMYHGREFVDMRNFLNYKETGNCYRDDVCSLDYLSQRYPAYCNDQVYAVRHLTTENACSTDEDKKVFRDFLTCTAIQALQRHETDCKPSNIIELIQRDPFNADLFPLDFQFDLCATEDLLIELDQEFTIGPNLCQSKDVVLWLLNPYPRYDSYGQCSVSTLPDDQLACSYVIEQMVRLRHSFIDRFNVECDMSTLVSTEFSTTHSLYLPDLQRDTCASTVENIDCTTGVLFTNFNDTTCLRLLYSQSYYEQDSLDLVCSVIPYVQLCLKEVAQRECGLDYNEEPLRYFFQEFLKVHDIEKAFEYCSPYEPILSNLPCANEEIPAGSNQCDDNNFITKVTLKACSDKYWHRPNSTTAMCIGYQDVVRCGVHATTIMNIQTSDGSDPKMGCPTERVNEALVSMSDDVTKYIPELYPNQCQGPCYLNIVEALNECVDPIRHIPAWTWQHTCPAYTYMYQCVRRFLEIRVDAPCDDVIKSAMSVNGFDSPYDCEDQSMYPEMDICANVTDLAEVLTLCSHELFDWNEYGNVLFCRNKTMLDECVSKTVMKYSRSCSIENLQQNVPTALVRMYSLYFGYVPGGREAIQDCYGLEMNPGYCMYIENTHSSYMSSYSECTFDRDCMDPLDAGLKCCYVGGYYKCSQPAEERAQFYATFTTSIEWMDYYRDTEHQFTRELIQNLTNIMAPMMVSIDMPFEVVYLSERFSYVSVIVNVWSFVHPEALIRSAIKTYLQDMPAFTLEYSYFNPEDTPGDCPYLGHCDDFSDECGSDYECRSRHGSNSKCCYHCGGKCVEVVNPGVCISEIETAWSQCEGELTVESNLIFRQILDNMNYWNEEHCRAFSNITSCIQGNIMTASCLDKLDNWVFEHLARLNGNDPSSLLYPSCDGTDKCSDISYLFNTTINQCWYDAQVLFEYHHTMLETCSHFQSLTRCVNHTAYFDLPCDYHSVESVLRYNMYEYHNWYMIYTYGSNEEYFDIDLEQCFENKCLKVSEIRNAMIGPCNDLHGRLLEPQSEDTCQLYFDLNDCVLNELRHEYYYCNETEVEMAVGDLLNKEGVMHNFSQCLDKTCSSRSFTHLAKNDCHYAMEAYMKDGHCRHVEAFLMCVKTIAMMKGETCTFSFLHEEMQSWVTHSDFEKVWHVAEYREPVFDLCPEHCIYSTHVSDTTVQWKITPGEDVAEFLVARPTSQDPFYLSFNNEYMSSTDRYKIHINSDDGTPVLENEFVSSDESIQTNNMFYDYQLTVEEVGDRQHFTFVRPISAQPDEQNNVPLNGNVMVSMQNSNFEPVTSEHNFDCTGDRYEQLEDSFPMVIDAENVCNNDVAIRYWLDYGCFDNFDMVLLNQHEQCLFEIYLAGCVHYHLKELGCTFDQISTTIKRPAARVNVIGPYNPTCDSTMISDCDRHVLITGKSATDVCFASIGPMLYYERMLGIPLFSIPNVNGNNTLGCSMVYDAVGCLQKHLPITGAESWLDNPNLNCNAMDYWSIGFTMLTIYEKGVVSGMEGMEGTEMSEVDQPQSSLLTDCPAPATLNYDDECPDSSTIVELLLAQCGIAIRHYVEEYNIEKCSIGMMLMECAKDSLIPLRMRMCNDPIEKIMEAMSAHTQYISDNFFEYDPIYCAGYQECRDHWNSNAYTCANGWWSLNPDNMDPTEFCGYYPYLEEGTAQCLNLSAPWCEMYIEEHLSASLNYLPFDYKGHKENCSTIVADVCDSVEMIANQKCVEYKNIYDPCGVIECVGKALPVECEADAADVARKTVLRFSNFALGECLSVRLNFSATFLIINESFISDFYDANLPNTMAFIGRYTMMFDLLFDALMMDYVFQGIYEPEIQSNGTSHGVQIVFIVLNQEDNPGRRIEMALGYTDHITLLAAKLAANAHGVCHSQFMEYDHCSAVLMIMSNSTMNHTEVCSTLPYLEGGLSNCLIDKLPVCMEAVSEYSSFGVMSFFGGSDNCSDIDRNVCQSLETIAFSQCYYLYDEGPCVMRECFHEVIQHFNCSVDMNVVVTRAVRRFMHVELPECILNEYEAVFVISNETFLHEYRNMSDRMTVEFINKYKHNFFDLFFRTLRLTYKVSELLPYNYMMSTTSSDEDTANTPTDTSSQSSALRRKRQVQDDTQKGVYIKMIVFSPTNPQDKMNKMMSDLSHLHHNVIFLSHVTTESGWKWYESCDGNYCSCPEFCTADYSPVCACSGDECTTYSNYCQLQVAACNDQMYGDTIPTILDGECEDQISPCSPSYFDIATTKTCDSPWKQFTDTHDCRDYELFLICIKVNAVRMGSYCTIGQINAFIAESVKAYELQPRVCDVAGFFDINNGYVILKYRIESFYNKMHLHMSTSHDWLVGLMFGLSDPMVLGWTDIWLLKKAENDETIHLTEGYIQNTELFLESESSIVASEYDINSSRWLLSDINRDIVPDEFGPHNVTIDGYRNATFYTVFEQDPSSQYMYQLVDYSKVIFDQMMYLEDKIPFSQHDLCVDVFLQRLILQQLCYDDEYLNAYGEQKCLIELRMRYCVLREIHMMGLECEAYQINIVFTSWNFRQELLAMDICDNDCSSHALDQMMNFKESIEWCFGTALGMLEFPGVDTIPAYELPSYSLTCRMYDLSMQCLLKTLELYAPNATCDTASNYHPAVIETLTILTEEKEDAHYFYYPSIYQTCTDNLDILEASSNCPTYQDLVYSIIPVCGEHFGDFLNEAISFEEKCTTVNECFNNLWTLYPLCEDDQSLESLIEQLKTDNDVATYYSNITGIYYDVCPGYGEF